MPDPIRRITRYQLARDPSGRPEYAGLASRLGVDRMVLQQTIEALQEQRLLSLRPDGTLTVSPMAVREERDPARLGVLLRLLGYEQTDVTRIVKRHGIAGGSAHVAGTRIPVWMVVRACRADGGRRHRVHELYPDLQDSDIDAALQYYAKYRDEIEQDLLDDQILDMIEQGQA